MAGSVLDASAVLALLRQEPGWEVVASRLEFPAHLSAPNLAEVLTWFSDAGESPASVRRTLDALLGEVLKVEQFSEHDAFRVADMRRATRSKGLSLGDRACLALGAALDLPVYTADRSWAGLAVGVEIVLIR